MIRNPRHIFVWRNWCRCLSSSGLISSSFLVSSGCLRNSLSRFKSPRVSARVFILLFLDNNLQWVNKRLWIWTEERPTAFKLTDSFGSWLLIGWNAFPKCGEVISQLWLDEEISVFSFSCDQFYPKISVKMKSKTHIISVTKYYWSKLIFSLALFIRTWIHLATFKTCFSLETWFNYNFSFIEILTKQN